MGLHRLLGLSVAVPDPAGLAAYYAELGLTTDGTGGFAGTDGGTQVRVEEGPFRRLLHVDVAAEDEATLAAAATRAAEHGLTPAWRDGVLQVEDPHTQVTFRLQVAPRWAQQAVAAPVRDNRPGSPERRNARAAGVTAGPRAPRRLGHMVIGTPNLNGTRDFLLGVLGFKMSDQFEGVIAFTRCSTDHHNVALVESPVPLLQHYSWECDDVDHVGHTATALLRADPARQVWGFGRHFVGSNYYWYLRDPSGAFVELYSDMDVIDDDDAWDATGRTTFGPQHIANSWGPDLPLEFIVPTDLEALQAGWAARSER